MKNSLARILSYCLIIGFILFWVLNIIVSLPSNMLNRKIVEAVPFVKKLYSNGWGFFRLPGNSNNRLYLLLRDSITGKETYRIELLEDIALQKQRYAPFNQKENLVDHLVNHSVNTIKLIQWHNRQGLQTAFTDSTASFYVKRSMEMTRANKGCSIHLMTLENYCKMVLAGKQVNIVGKEYKIILTEKFIKPFAERNNDKFITKEMVFFETPYAHFKSW